MYTSTLNSQFTYVQYVSVAEYKRQLCSSVKYVFTKDRFKS